MKNIKHILSTLLLLFLATNVDGQEVRKISGKIYSSLNTPIEGAIISSPGAESVHSNNDGTFILTLKQGSKQVSVWAVGYYPISRLVAESSSEIVVTMISEDQYKYNQSAVLPFRIEESKPVNTSAVNIAKKDFTLGSMTIDRALSGQVAGLRTTRFSGMPGEGTYMNIRGIRSFIGVNAPLVVINGVPYLPDDRESPLINGFSRNIFQAYNIDDIQNITVLKGAEASMYGSMGSNGVILIETDGATSGDLDTKISFSGQYGMNWNNKRMPLLKDLAYKSYLSDVGMTYFSNQEKFFNEFPFLNNQNSKYNYLYNNQTNWQDQIYNTSYVSDFLFRVEGGDAIAKYDLSLGYTENNGILKGTKSQRYHTQLNTNVLVNKKLEMFTTVGLAYLNGEYQEQGMISQTNPILAAYSQAPLLSPYKKDIAGNLLSTFSPYYYGNSTNMSFATSNPLAIVNTLDARNRQYDVNVKSGLTYKPTPELAFTGTVGLYYNYNNEHLFVPGVTDQTILPFFDQYGESKNSIKEGVGETFNLYTNLNARYNKVFNQVHALNVLAGAQVAVNKNEYDAGSGRNSPNDFYQTLGSTQALGRNFYGYLEKWNWMNFYTHADYTYNQLVTASLNMAVDGSSSTGTYGDHFYLYPSTGLTFLGKGWLPLSNSTIVNQFNVRAEYGLTGNSRFSSNYGKFYYSSSPYQNISGIVRQNIPNTKLKPEQSAQLNIGMDMTLFRNKLAVSVDYYNTKSSDVIFALPHSSVYGSAKYYDNLATIENQGVELSLQASLLRTRNFEWVVGGNIAHNKGKVKSLGGYNSLVNNYIDGAQLLSAVGLEPYMFYGYESAGVFSTQAEADKANLVNKKGQRYQAGDMHFVDQNGDNRIDDKDRKALGSAAPKYFGGVFAKVSYKSITMSAEFAYSKGNKAYNAVRRDLESLSTFGNQSLAVVNRWGLEGQVTDMPRAQWGDPVGNNDFSSRWIEDASFIKLRNVTLSYTFNKTFFNFFRSGTFYVAGENLLTITKYLGMDPEFSYSYADDTQGFDYAKLIQPKTVKFGVNLKF